MKMFALSGPCPRTLHADKKMFCPVRSTPLNVIYSMNLYDTGNAKIVHISDSHIQTRTDGTDTAGGGGVGGISYSHHILAFKY